MRKIQVRLTIRLMVGIAALIPFALTPQLAQAQTGGALTQLGGSNSCISAQVESECPTGGGDGLNETNGVVVSPNGKNVYAIGEEDDAVAEFTRNSDGSLTFLGCIADASSDGTCDNATATGLIGPEAIAISPDGENVYVGAEDTDGIGDIAEFAVNPNGSLTQLGTPNGCIAENTGQTDDEASACTNENSEETGPIGNENGHGIQFPDALTVSSDGKSVYAGDEDGEALAEFTRASDGSLSQPGGAADCIRDSSVSSDGADCTPAAFGVANVTGIALSPDPDNDNVYTAGESAGDSTASIAEFTRDPETGLLSAVGCLGTDDEEDCDTATGLVGLTGIVVSPDGNNVYTASEQNTGPIAEFSRSGEDGTLSQLTGNNNCIEEQGSNDGCLTTGIGIEDGYSLVMSPNGADVYAAGSTADCGNIGTCSDVAEFTRDASTGALTQRPTPDSCIQDESVAGSECPGNENGLGLGGPSLAISPDGNNLYVSGTNDIAEFARGTQTLSVSLAGSGTGAVSDGSGAIACPTVCSNAYTTDSAVTLTASPASGSTFTGWSGGCSGTSTCQVTMSADTPVTATFTSTATPPSPGSPTPVLTGAPAAVTDGGAGFSGSVNPDGLPTTAYFQYGLDKRYSQVGASGANYTAQTQSQVVGSDFTTHGVGPVSVTGLVPNALYHVRLVATNSAGTTFGQDVTFTTSHGPTPGPPTLGQTFNIEPVSGLVLIFIHGHLVPLTELTQIPAGVPIDTLHGTLELITATGGGGGAHDASAKTQHGEFNGAVFRLSQQTGGAGKGLVTLMLALSAFKGAPSQSICKSHGTAADATAASSRTIQLLHASAHGKFRTSGRYSAATVLGTTWTVTARCDGTLTHDITDSVAVTDFVRHKTIILHAGQSYLAPGRGKGG